MRMDNNINNNNHRITKQRKRAGRQCSVSIAFLCFLTSLWIIWHIQLSIWLTSSTTTTTTTHTNNHEIIRNKNDRMVGWEGYLESSDNNNNNSSNNNNHNADVEYHVIFSTDCSRFQRWQSYVLFYSAMRVKQQGHVTRIVSGCANDKEERNEQEWFDRYILEPMSSNFHIHFTPSFSQIPLSSAAAAGDEQQQQQKQRQGEYKFFNKPLGVLHWMEQYYNNSSSSLSLVEKEDAIIILVDPDMVLLHPLTHRISHFSTGKVLNVQHGRPVAQKYGLSTRWTRFDLTDITGDPQSPSMEVTFEDAQRFYPAGPPYFATARDFYNIVLHWSKFVHKVHLQYPHLLAEMYAYSVAAAHVRLPHVILPFLMVSNTIMSPTDEAWSVIDDTPAPHTCHIHFNSQQPPIRVFHYCQRYMLGKWFFGKRRMPKNFYSTCDDTHRLLPPPDNLATLYNYRINLENKRKDLHPTQVKREAYSICTMITAINQATDFFHQQHCSSTSPKFQPQTIQLWDLKKVP